MIFYYNCKRETVIYNQFSLVILRQAVQTLLSNKVEEISESLELCNTKKALMRNI